MQPIFTGVATAMVTPFDQDQIDWPRFQNLIERQIEQGVDALLFLGTTGEMPTLSHAERHAVIDFALATVGKRVPLIFGIGGNDPTTIIDLGLYVAEQARVAGVRPAIMVSAPYYNKATPDGLYAFFQKITNTVKLPTIIYNIPGRTGVNIDPTTMAKIARLRYVAGIKEASGNLHQITQVVALCPQIAVYSGDDTLALPCYAVGCRGIISVASNLAVTPVQNIYRLYDTGHPEPALTLFQSQLPLYQSLFRMVNPIPVKAELAKLGLIKNALRLPLLPDKWYNNPNGYSFFFAWLYDGRLYQHRQFVHGRTFARGERRLRTRLFVRVISLPKRHQRRQYLGKHGDQVRYSRDQH